MRRREFIAGVGSALAWPIVAGAQQSGMPVIAFVDARSADAIAGRLRGFRQGLKETGYVEGENVSIIYRFTENQIDQVPLLAADLIRRKVAVVATAGDHVAVLAKSSLGPTPLVFIVSKDPVGLGLVNSLAQPGGTVTGINFVTGELVAKRLEILREIVPTASRIAVLVNPANGVQAENTLSDLAAAAHSMGLDVSSFKASTSAEIDRAFESIVRDRYEALFVDSDPFFSGRRVHLVTLAMRHSIPTSFPNRESCGNWRACELRVDILDAWRQSGVYVGRILKGTRPMDLPVVDANKFELVINHQTAADSRPEHSTDTSCPCRRGDRVRRREFDALGERKNPFVRARRVQRSASATSLSPSVRSTVVVATRSLRRDLVASWTAYLTNSRNDGPE